MISNKYFGVAAACGLAFAGVSAAHAQATTPSAPNAAVVVPVVPVTTPNGHLAGPTQGAQVIGGVSGVVTASTPGTLGMDGLPSIDNAQAGNIAGVLTYCDHRKLVLGTTPCSVASRLAVSSDVKYDQVYSPGGRGLLQTGTTTPFVISTQSKEKQALYCRVIIMKRHCCPQQG